MSLVGSNPFVQHKKRPAESMGVCMPKLGGDCVYLYGLIRSAILIWACSIDKESAGRWTHGCFALEIRFEMEIGITLLRN